MFIDPLLLKLNSPWSLTLVGSIVTLFGINITVSRTERFLKLQFDLASYFILNVANDF